MKNKCNFLNCEKAGIYLLKFDNKIISRHCKDHMIFTIKELNIKDTIGLFKKVE